MDGRTLGWQRHHPPSLAPSAWHVPISRVAGVGRVRYPHCPYTDIYFKNSSRITTTICTTQVLEKTWPASSRSGNQSESLAVTRECLYTPVPSQNLVLTSMHWEQHSLLSDGCLAMTTQTNTPFVDETHLHRMQRHRPSTAHRTLPVDAFPPAALVAETSPCSLSTAYQSPPPGASRK